jgi:hypothetical protein
MDKFKLHQEDHPGNPHLFSVNNAQTKKNPMSLAAYRA